MNKQRKVNGRGMRGNHHIQEKYLASPDMEDNRELEVHGSLEKLFLKDEDKNKWQIDYIRYLRNQTLPEERK